MDITRHNLKENVKLISHAISNASVLAIDGEFTGLCMGEQSIHAFDTPQERYDKLRKGAMDFLLVQFGLCAFYYDETECKYVAKAFNFYICPRPFTRQAPDIKFACQSSSIDFLSTQGFDFNKVFKDGISYLRPADEQRLRDALNQRHQAAEQSGNAQSSPAFASPVSAHLSGAGPKGPVVVPQEHKPFVKDICEQVEAFQKSNSDSLALEPTNGFRRMITYQAINNKFKSGLHLRTKLDEKKRRYIEVTKVGSKEEERKKEEEKRAAEHSELDDAVGFSTIFKLISQSGKLVVGHNMLLDVMHTLHQFVAPLPNDYEDFKNMTRCCFPRLLDTKLMATSPPFKDHLTNTALEELLKSMDIRPFIKPEIVFAEGFPEYTTSELDKLHTAAFDAYVTGVCFITMSNFIGRCQKPPQYKVQPDSALIQPYMNKLFLMKIYDIPYMNLKGQDLSPCRDHVFHIRFPQEWRAADIAQLFSPFGNVQIVWLDDTSAFVGLYKKDQASYVMRTLRHGESHQLISYEQFRKSPVTTAKRKVPNDDMQPPVKKIHTAFGDNGAHVEKLATAEDTINVPSFEQTALLTDMSSQDVGVPLSRKVEPTTNNMETDKMFDDTNSW